MQPTSILVLGATILVILIILIYALIINSRSNDSIFKGSGKPVSMAKIVLSSIHITAQIFFGILVIGILSVMIFEDKITSDAGLPVVSGIVGYLLGKSFKDVYEGAPAKRRLNNTASEQQ
jgi:hypothetical protein